MLRARNCPSLIRACSCYAPLINSRPIGAKSENTMKTVLIRIYVCTCLLGSSLALADSTNEMIAIAESAAPKVVTANATIKAQNGTVLRKNSNSYTCYPQQKVI